MTECKNLLLIMPKFYGYERKVQDGLTNWGIKKYSCIYSNFPSFNCLHRMLILGIKFLDLLSLHKYPEFLKKALIWISGSYFLNKLKKLDLSSFDTILLIRGMYVSTKVMDYLKASCPKARFVMYQWDSVKNNPNALLLAKYFSKILTFDPVDTKNYGWKYRPMFYTATNNPNKPDNKDLDVFALCHITFDRIKFMNKLKNWAKTNNLKSYIKIYWQFGKLKQFIEIHLTKTLDILGLDEKENFISKPINIDETANLFKRSKIAAEFCHSSQSGLTPRAVESVGAKCKFITNNSLVKDTDFYNENNVFIYDPENFDIPKSFIDSPYIEYKPEIYRYYSINGWLESLLD